MLFFCGFLSGQVVFREPPNYKPNIENKSFWGISETRSISFLNGTWSVYPANRELKKKVSIKIPSVFESNAELIFEKSFQISETERLNYSFELVFLGLNYRADISVNEVIIYRHLGGEFPFTVDLGRDVLRSDSTNLLSVKLFYELDSEITIPVKQRFMFTKNYGGILHDVYICKKPNVNISRVDISSEIDKTGTTASIKLVSGLIDKTIQDFQSEGKASKFYLRSIVKSPDGNIVKTSPNIPFELERNNAKTIEHNLSLENPSLWSPAEPNLYNIRLELWQRNTLLDVIERTSAIYSVNVTDKSLLLNNEELKLTGVTYLPEVGDYGDLMNYGHFETDIKMIKETGFNAIRISKMVPHPYILELCGRYGLLVFIELPIGMLPGKISRNPNFTERCKNFVSGYISAFKKYPAVIGIGLGSSYLGAYDSHRSLLANLSEQIKTNSDWITFASFGNLEIEPIENIDMYGLELLNELPADILVKINDLQNKLGLGRVFLSEITYTVNSGNTDGYVNKYSYEAQAKFYSDLIDYSQNNILTGYFINSFTDIKGDYSSLISGYDEDNLYRFGLLNTNREAKRIAYKVVSFKLKNTEKVTIPIGSTKDDAPMVFILFGLLLALFMGILVNSGKKFRDDASRALLRPYNYYADVRDQRIMSPYHSAFLGGIITIVNALIISNILFYLKTNIIFEKLLLSFGSQSLISAASYLSWNPFEAIVWITILGILFFLLTVMFIKAASLFIRQQVHLVSIYFVVVWAFLPLVFLIPLGIVLYRVLVADIVNVYIYITLIILVLWVLHRLFKGIYVIFDASPGATYFYCTMTIAIIVGGFFMYYEINNSAIQYILFILKQYSIIG